MLGALLALLAAGPVGELRATFVGNTAVHLTDGRVAILTDFPYQSGAFGYMEWSKALVPARPAPLCLITHSHDDHFAPRLAKDFCGRVLGPEDVVSASGVAAVDLKGAVRWEGISIVPQATPHARLEHYSYLVEWGGKRIFFSGDTESTDALLAAKGLDVAFVSPWLLKTVAKLGQKIDAARVVVYHHRADEAVPDIEGRLVPRQGDVLGLSLDSKALRVLRSGPAVLPAPDAHDFEARLGRARKGVETPDGRAYDGIFSKHFYGAFARWLSECREQTAEAGAAFDLVLELAADGRVEGGTARPETKLTACFLARVGQEMFPAPPSAGFEMPVSIRFKSP